MPEDNFASNINVYISKNCPTCDAVIGQLNKWNVPYRVKNVTNNKEVLHEMQNKGLYGTPATLHENLKKQVLGFNKTELRRLVKSERVVSRNHTLTFLLNHNN